ncbi:MAG: HDOD domain-containing protein [Nitrospina sp.]|nr:HDOD domain-containing protein [Nitrospina sp.]MBT3874547.1 HDOD domain-containing protein [Nitrospina sp.]MBT4049850.1 HDOD domain-containing protein [Nitrospina sp.]MBT4557884.1 HDOD domain-containing protein [Nitrospina sp.]MBT5349477.1 HDOD domain-containing protein [Nitrospina sp.]
MDIQDLLDDDVSIVSLPSVYYQFQEAMSDKNSSFAEIGEIIIYDSGLTTRLLKIVNSAYYGLPAKIEKVSHAIGWIGTDELSNLLLSTVVIDQFNSIPNSVINMESFWQHAIACGLIARKLASYNEVLDPEKFFVAGMLHDIGQIVLCTKLPELTLKILLEAQSQNQPLHVLEDHELGFNHAELGGRLLEKWNLSEFHIETTEFHHKPAIAPNYSMESSILYYADILANTMKLGCSGESATTPALDEENWERLQVSGQIILPDLKEEIHKEYNETVSLFLQSA